MTTRWLLQPELQQPVSHARGAETTFVFGVGLR